jgi:hypothetical protein
MKEAAAPAVANALKIFADADPPAQGVAIGSPARAMTQ